MKATVIFTSFFFMLSFIVFAEKHTKNSKNNDETATNVLSEGDRHFKAYSYLKAINYYKDQIKKGNMSVLRNLAESYRRTHNTTLAIQYYKKLVEMDNEVKPIDYYHYSLTLRSNKEYKESVKWMEKYHSLTPHDVRAKKIVSNKDYHEDLLNHDESVVIKNLNINTDHSDFGVSIFQDSMLIITSTRNSAKDRFCNSQWLNMYYGKMNNDKSIDQLECVGKSVNKQYHEGPGMLSADGETLIFTRSNYIGSKKTFTQEHKMNKLQLMQAKKSENGWEEIEILPFSGDEFSTAHPSLSADGNIIYFSSDRPGGFGKSDLYYATKLSDGTWSEAINMGSEVNTEGNETFPYIHESGLFFFSSDGHPGLGGYDLFLAEFHRGKINYIENLGAPINSEKDDIGITLGSKLDFGYFSSNREGGKGKDDIYSFLLSKPFHKSAHLSIEIIKEGTEKTINNAVVYLKKENNGEIVDSMTVNENGIASFSVRDDISNYVLYATADGYENSVLSSFVEEEELQYQINKRIEIPANKVKEVDFEFSRKDIQVSYQGDNQKTALLPLAFDFNSSEISEEDSHEMLDETYLFLQAHPNYTIHIKAHTDCRGRSDYNLELSTARAKVITDFFLSKGIEEDRLSYEGLGEDHPIVLCNCNLPAERGGCSEREHYENRRSEVVLKLRD